MNIYIYCNSNRTKKDESIPVYIVVKTTNGRFFVNTGLTTREKFVGREFPKDDKNRVSKNSAQISVHYAYLPYFN